MIDAYRLIGRLAVPCDRADFAQAFAQDRRVAETEIDFLRVSTVFLGLDHSFGHGPPLLFETMIFGDDADVYQTRCTTWDEAERMHAAAEVVATSWLARAETTVSTAMRRRQPKPRSGQPKPEGSSAPARSAGRGAAET